MGNVVFYLTMYENGFLGMVKWSGTIESVLEHQYFEYLLKYIKFVFMQYSDYYIFVVRIANFFIWYLFEKTRVSQHILKSSWSQSCNFDFFFN